MESSELNWSTHSSNQDNFNVTNRTNELELINNCTNDYCMSDEDYLKLVEDYVFPTPYEWVLILMHTVVFVVGIVGNFLVSLAVYRNQSMQTVTNYFIVNLAVADFLVILVCLPPTVLWDVTETWFFGSVLCKMVVFTQTASISVSVLTLTFISMDRWYAICYPLKFKSTTARAKTAIAFIWIASISIAIPELIVLQAVPKQFPMETVLLTDCMPLWHHEQQKSYQLVQMVLLYMCPLLLMTIAYCQIVRVLWKNNIPGSAEVRSKPVDGAGKKHLVPGPNSSTEVQIRTRRKVAKMLIAVVVMFGICYFPVHLLNVLRYSIQLDNNDFTITASLLSHWLCYANSAMNPVIYNFMSGKFKKEFQRALRCNCMRRKFRGRVRGQASTTTYSFNRTTMETFRMNSVSTN